LLDQFKQFLPENSAAGLGAFMQAANAQAVPDKVPAKRGSKEVKEAPPQKKRRAPAEKGSQRVS
jgi:hypothetical protein